MSRDSHGASANCFTRMGRRPNTGCLLVLFFQIFFRNPFCNNFIFCCLFISFLLFLIFLHSSSQFFLEEEVLINLVRDLLKLICGHTMVVSIFVLLIILCSLIVHDLVFSFLIMRFLLLAGVSVTTVAMSCPIHKC